MEAIKDLFSAKATAAAAEIKEIIKTNGDKKIGEVTLAQAYQGMRGITGLVTETSLLDAQEGIRFRGFSIPELQSKLPKAPGGDEPLPEGLFYLMMVGEIPTEEDVKQITNNWQRRSHVPTHVFDVIDAFPISAHPMTMYVAAVMALQTESKFSAAYAKGMNKKDYWLYTYEDSMDLIARLPRVAAYIYRRKYKNNEHI
jgi:citrate synthase